MRAERRAVSGGGLSDRYHSDTLGVVGECLQVANVAGEDCPAGFGNRHHEGIDGRAASCAAAELSGSSGDGHGDGVVDDAGLQESVHVYVAARVTLQGLDEDHGRYHWRPQVRRAQRADQCQWPR